jgi:ABC-type multidrug transport system fused ATPase/permease subunit
MTDDLILTILGSFLPVIITTLIAWLGNRSLSSKRGRTVSMAKQRVDFIHAYISAQNASMGDSEELAQIRQSAAKELSAIKKSVEEDLRKIEKVSPQSGNFLQRFFLLYKMYTRLAAFFRVLFYLTLVVSFFWSMLFTSIIRTFIAEGSYSLFISLLVLLLFIMPAVLIVFLMRWLAVKADKPGRSA